jgi:hypothetical protein
MVPDLHRVFSDGAFLVMQEAARKDCALAVFPKINRELAASRFLLLIDRQVTGVDHAEARVRQGLESGIQPLMNKDGAHLCQSAGVGQSQLVIRGHGGHGGDWAATGQCCWSGDGRGVFVGRRALRNH